MKYGRVLALGMLAVLLLVVVAAPAPGNSRFMAALHDAVHAPVFGLFALLLLFVLRRSPSFERLSVSMQYGVVFVATVLAGCASELVQALTHRNPSFADATRDLLGAGAFLLLGLAFDPRIHNTDKSAGRGVAKRRTLRMVSIGAALVLITIPLGDLFTALIQYRSRDQRFPVLMDFSRQSNDYFVGENEVNVASAQMPNEWARVPGELALQIEFKPGKYPGIAVNEPVADWRGWKSLEIDVTNPMAQTLQLVLRIHDSHHNNAYADRFNTALSLKPGTRQTLQVAIEDIATGPRSRRLDLAQVAGIAMFVVDASGAERMYLSRIVLK